MTMKNALALPLAFCALAAAAGEVALVPAPRSMTVSGGRCPRGAKVAFSTAADIPREGYRIRISETAVEVASADAAGRLYANVTLDQLKGEDGSYPCCAIDDAPAFPWRGWLIDACRHFVPKEHMLDLLDIMVLHKLNVLHWHLTEDQAWRLPVAKYPKLVEYGAVRPYNPDERFTRWHRVREWVEDGLSQRYGPYSYTRRDIAEVCAYARARHVRIVPEIDMPGHMRAALAAHPEFGCRAEALATNRVPRAKWGVEDDVLCVGNDATVAFLEDVLDEVCELFPDSDLIHLGGDECPVVRWKTCPKCQARMRTEGLRTERGLQGWLMKRMVAHLAKKGRRAVGWAEVVEEPSLGPKDVIPMTWIYPERGDWKRYRDAGVFCPTYEELADRGFDFVVGSHTHEYWGTPHGYGDPYEPIPPKRDPWTLTSLEDTYGLDLSCGEPKPGKGRILGTQAYSWGETTWNFFDYLYKAMPRTCAVAELCWTNPQPKDYRDFHVRMQKHAARLRAMRIPCAPLDAPGSGRRD